MPCYFAKLSIPENQFEKFSYHNLPEYEKRPSLIYSSYNYFSSDDFIHFKWWRFDLEDVDSYYVIYPDNIDVVVCKPLDGQIEVFIKD
jgi:hypothetical protein